MTRAHRWSATDIPDQTGRTFVVTGANGGVGLAATPPPPRQTLNPAVAVAVAPASKAGAGPQALQCKNLTYPANGCA